MFKKLKFLFYADVGILSTFVNTTVVNYVVFIVGLAAIIALFIASIILISYHKRIVMLEEAYTELKSESRIDTLTGMQNRNAFQADVDKITKYCEESLACLYIDVNGLKYLNDNKGHEEGDRMLQVVAKAIMEYFGKDFTYRLGGDEFVVFIIDPRHSDIKEKTDKLLAEIKKDGYYVSVGWQIHDLDGLSVKDLIKDAENFMYQEKVKFYKQAGFDRRTNGR